MDIFHLPWYYVAIYVLGAVLLLWLADKFKIIKSKPLRYFIFIIVYNLIWGVIYDLFLAA